MASTQSFLNVCAIFSLLVSSHTVFGQSLIQERSQLNDAAAATSIDCSCEPIRTMRMAPQPVTRPVFARGGLFTSQFITTNQDPEGDMPRDLAITPDGSTVVIINRDTDNMTFMDVNSRTITHTVAVEDFPVHVAVTPDGQYAIAPNVFSNSVSIVDIATHSLVANVPVTGQQPYRVVVTSDSQFAVVGIVNDATNSAFSVIDLNSMTEIRSFASTGQGSFGGFFTPESGIFGNIYTQFALSSDDTTLVLPDRGNFQVAVYDISTGAETLISTAEGPTAVDISSDGTKALISHEGNGQTVSVIDLTGLTLSNSVSTFPIQLFNQVVRFTPDNQFAIAAASGNSLIFVNLSNGAINTLATGNVGDIEISFDGQYAFVTTFNARVIDIASQTIVRTITFAQGSETVTSPTELRAIALNNGFREDALVYNIDGASGFFEGSLLSGEIEEGDASRTLAFTPDGSKIVIANNTSDNASIVDVATGNIEAYVPTGARSFGVAVSPDGTTAIVANAADNNVSIIDIATRTNLVNLPINTLPAEVVISPDSQTAFVTSVSGTDRIHFIDLDGANSSVVSSLVAGQMGSIVYTYIVTSGMTVSPDGSVLAACISFDDELLLIDTATRSVLTRVPVGDFPIRVAFSPDSEFAYVTNSFSNDVTIVSIDGASSQVEDVASNINFPLDVVVSADGLFAYAASFDFNNPSIKIVNTTSGNVVRTIGLNDRPRRLYLSHPTSTLYAMTDGGELLRINASGPSSSVIDSTQLSNGGSDMAFNEATGTVAVAQPIPDGFDVVRNIFLGDVNRDGAINLLDIGPFVAILSGGSFQLEADINQDGVVDLLDIGPFVQLLLP